jgi:4-coumarate--CoA ligase
MTIRSRWTAHVPRCSLQQWIFRSACEPVADVRAFMDPEDPDNNFLTLENYRLLSKRVALGLLAEGLQTGDRVLLFSGNSLYFPSVFLGVLMAGGIFTGANPTYVARELAYQLKDSGASFLFVAEAALGTALQAADEAGLSRDRIFVLGGNRPAGEVATSTRPAPGRAGRVQGIRHWTEILPASTEDQARQWQWTEPADPENTTCCLNYSSGTTGVPKGVEISHYSYVSNGVNVSYMAHLDPDHEEKAKRTRVLCFLPMYHAYAQTFFVANYPHEAQPVYVMPGFDFAKMLAYVQRYRITSIVAVPPIVVALAKHPLARKFDLSSIESVGSGAAPLDLGVMQEVQSLWPSGNVIVRQGWGMSEVTCTVTSWDPASTAKESSSVGELVPSWKMRLVSTDGKETFIEKPNVPGELWVSGPGLMRRYWRKPKETADTLWVDPVDGTRWLRTGDVAYVESYETGAMIHIVDRIKELIKVKGNQVAPAELEGILLERHDIADAAVIGVYINGEEVPRAYITLVEGVKPSDELAKDIADWLAGKVVRYKQLKGGVKFIDAIPKNPVSFSRTCARCCIFFRRI